MTMFGSNDDLICTDSHWILLLVGEVFLWSPPLPVPTTTSHWFRRLKFKWPFFRELFLALGLVEPLEDGFDAFSGSCVVHHRENESKLWLYNMMVLIDAAF